MKSSKAFLKSGIILTLALVVICVFMPEWGVAQILIVLLVGVLAGAQWALFFYLRKH